MTNTYKTMEREQLKGKQTPGKATIDLSGYTRRPIVVVVDGMTQITLNEANAALYAEAHNVANEHGMWPLDMLARIRELEGALRTLRSAVKVEAAKDGQQFCEELREAYNAAEYILNKKP